MNTTKRIVTNKICMLLLACLLGYNVNAGHVRLNPQCDSDQNIVVDKDQAIGISIEPDQVSLGSNYVEVSDPAAASVSGAMGSYTVTPNENAVGKEIAVTVHVSTYDNEGTCSEDWTYVFYVMVPKIEIIATHSLLQNEAVANLGAFKFKLECTPTAALNKAAAFAWISKAHSPNVNNPSLPFTDADKKETGISNCRWYGHKAVGNDEPRSLDPEGHEEDGTNLRWIGNVMGICSYEVTCEITFPEEVKIMAAIKKVPNYNSGKYFYVSVSDGGSTTQAYLINVKLFDFEDQGDVFKVTGKGDIQRQKALITKLPDAGSQFYNKTKTHEEVHESEWETKVGGKFVYFNADEFYDRIKEFTAPSEDKLKTKVYDEYLRYKSEQEAAYRTAFGTLQDREKGVPCGIYGGSGKSS